VAREKRLASIGADDMQGKKLSEFLVAVLAFLSMMGAAFLGIFSKTWLSSDHLPDDTSSAVRLVANLFVVMTSLLLGLMLTSAKNTLETNNRNIRALATELILLDRIMRGLGPEGQDARRHLVEYVQTSLKGANILEEDPQAEASLDVAGTSLRAIRVSDKQKVALWNDVRQLYRQVVQQRWVVIDASGGTIPKPLIVMLILWLTIVFVGFGYRAPRNTIVPSLASMSKAQNCAHLLCRRECGASRSESLSGRSATTSPPVRR
jgi:hypothetical protein